MEALILGLSMISAHEPSGLPGEKPVPVLRITPWLVVLMRTGIRHGARPEGMIPEKPAHEKAARLARAALSFAES